MFLKLQSFAVNLKILPIIIIQQKLTIIYKNPSELKWKKLKEFVAGCRYSPPAYNRILGFSEFFRGFFLKYVGISGIGWKHDAHNKTTGKKHTSYSKVILLIKQRGSTYNF